MFRHTPSTLWLLATTQFGGMVQAAAAIGVCANTLYNCSLGARVSETTRQKIEATFGVSLEVLQSPISQAVEASV